MRNAGLLLLVFGSIAGANPEALRSAPCLPSPSVVAKHAPSGPRRWGVFAAGASVFAVAWAADVGTSYGSHAASSSTSLIPVLGPLLQLREPYRLMDPPKLPPGIDTHLLTQVNQTYQTLIYVGLAVDAVAQLAGLVTAIVGLATHPRARQPALAFAPGGISGRF